MGGSIFIFGAILGLIVILLSNMNTETIITIHSKYGTVGKLNGGRKYTAIRKTGLSGNSIFDWDYYYNNEIIKDKNLIKLLFKSFVDEDWYGDYSFYVDDKDYHDELTNLDNDNIDYLIDEIIEELKK